MVGIVESMLRGSLNPGPQLDQLVFTIFQEQTDSQIFYILYIYAMSWDPFHHDPDPGSVLRKIFVIIFFLEILGIYARPSSFKNEMPDF